MDLLEYMRHIGCPIQPYQEAVIRELMKRQRIEVVVSPKRHVCYGDIHLSTSMPYGTMRHMVAEMYSCIEFKHQPVTSRRPAGIKSQNSGPHWMLDKYNIPLPPPRHMDIPSTTQALLSRIGV